jgi:hypothetical protein
VMNMRLRIMVEEVVVVVEGLRELRTALEE